MDAIMRQMQSVADQVEVVRLGAVSLRMGLVVRRAAGDRDPGGCNSVVATQQGHHSATLFVIRNQTSSGSG